MNYILSFSFFFIGYFAMLHKSIKYPLIYGKYTYWVYAELIALLPLMMYFREARHIAIVNSFGLGMGIHSFYFTSTYTARGMRNFYLSIYLYLLNNYNEHVASSSSGIALNR